MKTTKKKTTLSTDYFFESLYKKVKSVLSANVLSKIAAVKVLTIFSWFKDIN